MSDSKPAKPGLGRGLSALLGEDTSADMAALDRARDTRSVPVEQLHPGKYQPRQHFDEEHLESLAASIREKGVLQPVLVRRDPQNANLYEIIAGERRWRAAQMAQLHDIPIVVRELNDTEALQIALIENLQRQDLSPLEEAEAYKQLIDQFGHTQNDIAKSVGKSRSHIANTLRLLNLPEEVQKYIREGQLSAGSARALITSDDPVGLAREIINRGLNVRDVENIRRQVKDAETQKPAPKGATSAAPKDADTRALEESLTAALGLAITIQHKRNGQGQVQIKYQTLEQLDEICQRLSGS